MMQKVSVCLILNNEDYESDYWGTIYSFERSGFVIIEKKSEFIIKDAPKEYIKVIDNVEVELLVAYTDKSSKKLIEYFKPIATELIEVKHKKDVAGAICDAQAYNELFVKAKNEFICIVSPYIFFQQHWLTELIYYHQNVGKSGIIGICTDFSNADFSPLPSPDIETFVNVFLPKGKTINTNGVLFFPKEYLYYIGALDESVSFICGHELTQYQLRCVAMGLTNYYIPTQSCVIVNEHRTNKYWSSEIATSEAKITKTLAEMRKHKTYYIQLSKN